jgi:ribosomal protein L30E
MESLYRTPLLDCFRRGEVAADIRMMAAQGVFAARAHEQLGLLVLLSTDGDAGIRAATEATIARIPRPDLARFLGRPDVAREIVEFFAGRGIEPLPPEGPQTDGPLVEADAPGAVADEGEDASGEPDEARRMATVQRLALMTVSEKIKAAMLGSREERSILIRDPNKLVSLAVLSCPKVNEREIESYAKMANVSEDVLRVIGTSRAWTKSYAIVRSLAFNPKAPIAVSMTLVSRLVEKDVRMLSVDRNIAEPVKLLARKAMQAGQSRRG